MRLQMALHGYRNGEGDLLRLARVLYALDGLQQFRRTEQSGQSFPERIAPDKALRRPVGEDHPEIAVEEQERLVDRLQDVLSGFGNGSTEWLPGIFRWQICWSRSRSEAKTPGNRDDCHRCRDGH